MMRLFYGIPIPDTVRAEVEDCRNTLQRRGIRAGNWSAPRLYHITCLFLGERPETELPVLRHIGAQVASEHQPFSLAATHVGVFLRNQILWAGLADGPGYDTLRSLHKGLSQSVSKQLPFQMETRPYAAHLTLARKLDRYSWSQVFPGDTGMDLHITWEVPELVLFESTRDAQGLVYRPMERFPFRSE